MLVQWISFILFLAYFSFQIIYNLIHCQKILDALRDGSLTRKRLYLNLIAGLWVPVLLLLALAAFGVFSLDDIGVGLRRFACPQWLFYTSCALALVYFVYLLYTFTALRAKRLKGETVDMGIPEKMRLMLPASPGEKRLWALTSVLVGVGEEALFRGFLFYILLALFPALPLFLVLVFATLFFGAGHLYQGIKEAIKPLIIGLLFGVFYISFGTIWPCVVLHALQDACAMYAE